MVKKQDRELLYAILFYRADYYENEDYEDETVMYLLSDIMSRYLSIIFREYPRDVKAKIRLNRTANTFTLDLYASCHLMPPMEICFHYDPDSRSLFIHSIDIPGDGFNSDWFFFATPLKKEKEAQQ